MMKPLRSQLLNKEFLHLCQSPIFFFQQLRRLVPRMQSKANSLVQSHRVLRLEIWQRTVTVIHTSRQCR